MLRIDSAGRTLSFPVAFTEADVRRLCGDVAFARGNALQQAGSVLAPTLGGGVMRAQVKGTWERIDWPVVHVIGGRLEPECTCDEGRFCRHVAALLLQWLRRTESFAPAQSTPEAEAAAVSDLLADTGEENAEDDLADLTRLLDADTAPHLRQIVRRRGFNITARNKAELVAALATALADAEGISGVLAELEPDDRLLLGAYELAITARARSPVDAAALILKVSGRTVEPGHVRARIDAWHDLGLVVGSQTSGNLALPGVVRRQLQPAALLRTVPYKTVRHALRDAGHGVQRLGLAEIFQVLVHELARGTVGAEPASSDPDLHPFDWELESDEPSTGGTRAAYVTNVRLMPLNPLPPSDLQYLRDRIGRPISMIDFALQLLYTLEIVDEQPGPAGARLVAEPEHLAALLSFTPEVRTKMLVSEWLTIDELSELRGIVGDGGALQLHAQVIQYTGGMAIPRMSSLRHALLELIKRLPPGDTWYDFENLLDLYWALSPNLLQAPAGWYGQQGWWFTTGDKKHRKLQLQKAEDWRTAWRALVGFLLAVPLAWFGLVEVATVDAKPLAFRVLPATDVLAGRANAIPRSPARTSGKIVVDVDRQHGVPTVFVPAGAASEDVHGFLGAYAELAEASRRGLLYRITPANARRMFQSGATSGDLIAWLEHQSEKPIPAAVRERLRAWGAGYGTVRLYDDVTLIELADDILLRELLVTTHLQDALVHQLSPRLVAVEPTRAQSLIDELVRIGHTPRVVESVS